MKQYQLLEPDGTKTPNEYRDRRIYRFFRVHGRLNVILSMRGSLERETHDNDNDDIFLYLGEREREIEEPSRLRREHSCI